MYSFDPRQFISFPRIWQQQKKRINTGEKTKFQLKLVKWSKENANSHSHLRKINEKNKTKDRTPHIPLADAVTREINTALAVICAQNQQYTKRNAAIASAATFAQNQWYDTLKNLKTFAPVVTCSENLQQSALREPKTFVHATRTNISYWRTGWRRNVPVVRSVVPWETSYIDSLLSTYWKNFLSARLNYQQNR